jgi:hypothetical protein
MQLMTERDTLRKLIDDGRVATSLRRGSPAKYAIAALQTLLHWLGFDQNLKWDKFGADGDYGKSTAAAGDRPALFARFPLMFVPFKQYAG